MTFGTTLVPVILVRFQWKLHYLNTFSKKKKYRISNFMKICRVGDGVVPCGQTERQTDDEANSRSLAVLGTRLKVVSADNFWLSSF